MEPEFKALAVSFLWLVCVWREGEGEGEGCVSGERVRERERGSEEQRAAGRGWGMRGRDSGPQPHGHYPFHRSFLTFGLVPRVAMATQP